MRSLRRDSHSINEGRGVTCEGKQEEQFLCNYVMEEEEEKGKIGGRGTPEYSDVRGCKEQVK